MAILSNRMSKGSPEGPKHNSGRIHPNLDQPKRDTALTQDPGFRPEESGPRALRDALGRYASGVAIVTCATDTGPLGMTINSFASLSLEPALVLWSPAKASSRHAPFVAAPHFAIHVLGAHQMALATSFVSQGAAFDGLDWTTSAAGVPLLADSLVRFECDLHTQHDAGDHTLIIGQVRHVLPGAGEPLIFATGRFGGIGPLDPSAP